MKNNLKYSFLRILFGFYMIWLGLASLHHIKIYEVYVKNTFDVMDENFNLEFILNIFNLHEDPHAQTIKEFKPNFSNFKKSTNEIIYLQSLSLILGGLLCIFGFSLGFTFILIGILIDLIFIHNIIYFAQEKMKVNVLKYI